MSTLWKYVWPIGVTLLLAMLLFGGYRCGQSSRDDEVGGLLVKLTQTQKTSEIKEGLYATSLVQMGDLNRLLTEKDVEVARLKKTIDDTKALVLTTERVEVRWKQAYSAPTEATQVPVPAPTTGLIRQRVDFRHDFGPFLVSGYTLTDPPEGNVTVTQGRPLDLTLAVARNRDGTWSSLVTSSEPGMAVNVTLGGVDPGILKPRWYQRLWATTSVSALPDPGASLGLEYRGDRVSLGPQCQAWSGGWGCGLSFGLRIFN